MKKIICLTLSLFALFSLGCDDKKKDSAPSKGEQCKAYAARNAECQKLAGATPTQEDTAFLEEICVGAFDDPEMQSMLQCADVPCADSAYDACGASASFKFHDIAAKIDAAVKGDDFEGKHQIELICDEVTPLGKKIPTDVMAACVRYSGARADFIVQLIDEVIKNKTFKANEYEFGMDCEGFMSDDKAHPKLKAACTRYSEAKIDDKVNRINEAIKNKTFEANELEFTLGCQTLKGKDSEAPERLKAACLRYIEAEKKQP